MRSFLARCLFAAAAIAAPAAGAEPHKDGCLVLVSVDGLAGFYLDDPKADLPTLRRLAREGARAEGLVCSFPSVTWPNHTTLVTGVPPARHGVIGNNYLDRESGSKVPFIPDPLFDKDEIVRSPTVYDAAHDAGLVTAGIVWPATRNAKTLDWTVPDMFGDEAWPQYGTRPWLAELTAAGIPVDRHGAWTREQGGGVPRDWLYTRMARHLFEHHPPNLLMIHLVEVDHVQHKHGPRSPEAYWSVSYADDRLHDLVEFAKRSPYGEKTTFVIASDHGFFPIEHDIRPNVLLRQKGLLTVEDGKLGEKRAFAVSQGGGCMIYILDDERRAEIAAELTEAFESLEGVAAVIGPDDFASIGQPTRAEDPRAPDLWLSAKSGYAFSDDHSGEAPVARRAARGGTHGYLPGDPDMLGSLVISGYGVKSGVSLGRVSNLDVAPTIAALLGISLPSADGKPLTKILKWP
ncbi:MAG: ectonucleotide pyrophosphatase/phosphodiesterase [Planctomycetes bacterium]|nr:ectonucleotide pyrophosphatase/phosphodiesterase [Planctomycetota bacterium]